MTFFGQHLVDANEANVDLIGAYFSLLRVLALYVRHERRLGVELAHAGQALEDGRHHRVHIRIVINGAHLIWLGWPVPLLPIILLLVQGRVLRHRHLLALGWCPSLSLLPAHLLLLLGQWAIAASILLV